MTAVTREPIYTRESLDALPVGTVCVDRDQYRFQKLEEGTWRQLECDLNHTYGSDEIAGEYNPGGISMFFPMRVVPAPRIYQNYSPQARISAQDALLDEGYCMHAVDVVLDACESEDTVVDMADVREVLANDWPNGGREFEPEELEAFLAQPAPAGRVVSARTLRDDATVRVVELTFSDARSATRANALDAYLKHSPNDSRVYHVGFEQTSPTVWQITFTATGDVRGVNHG